MISDLSEFQRRTIVSRSPKIQQERVFDPAYLIPFKEAVIQGNSDLCLFHVLPDENKLLTSVANIPIHISLECWKILLHNRRIECNASGEPTQGKGQILLCVTGSSWAKIPLQMIAAVPDSGLRWKLMS